LIQSANRMSRLIDPRRPKELTEEQSAQIREQSEIQELRGHRDEMSQRIRKDFKFIYCAKGQPIYEEYEEVKRLMDRRIKEREKELLKQVQREYDVAAPVQDILAQVEGNEEVIIPILPTPGSVCYAFLERARIAKAFFDPPSTCGAEGDLDWRISIVDDMVSLCNRQEGIFRKPRRVRRMHLNDAEAQTTLKAVETEPESESSVPPSFKLECKPYQCLYCLGNAALPLEERRCNLGSKYSLQRHFDRRHPFQPGRPCPFPHPECAAVRLDQVKDLKNHAAMVHDIFMPAKI